MLILETINVSIEICDSKGVSLWNIRVCFPVWIGAHSPHVYLVSLQVWFAWTVLNMESIFEEDSQLRRVVEGELVINSAFTPDQALKVQITVLHLSGRSWFTLMLMGSPVAFGLLCFLLLGMFGKHNNCSNAQHGELKCVFPSRGLCNIESHKFYNMRLRPLHVWMGLPLV